MGVQLSQMWAVLKVFNAKKWITHFKIAGSMHSGYPMMGFTSAEADHVNTVNIRQKGTIALAYFRGELKMI